MNTWKEKEGKITWSSIISQNFPEPTTASQNTCNDTQAFSELVKSEFNISEVKITKAVRLKQSKPDKPRLLLITLGDLSTKRNILQQATKLCKSTSWNNVFISPDLTPKEHESNRKLREELKARKDAGEKDLYIRIVVDPNRSSRKQNQSIWLENDIRITKTIRSSINDIYPSTVQSVTSCHLTDTLSIKNKSRSSESNLKAFVQRHNNIKLIDSQNKPGNDTFKPITVSIMNCQSIRNKKAYSLMNISLI